MRRILLVAALLFSAQAVLANNPSSLTGARMVYDDATGLTILFGGVTPFDQGRSDYINPTETWVWNGLRWMQLFPSSTPPGRSSHVMVYDAKRDRVILFGGRLKNGNEATDLNDTWAFAGNQWTQITTTDAPSIRAFSGAAYDRARDRVVLFGGSNTVPPPAGTAVAPTITNRYDTWEFDGTNWTKVADNGPQVINPILVYDEARNQIVMIGEDTSFNPLMYTYDPSAHTWTQVTPQTMPPCTNQANAAFERASGTIFLTGGVCVTEKVKSGTIEEQYSWDGTNWTKLVAGLPITKTSNPALTYDARRDVMVIYGGTEAYGSPHAYTYTFDPALANPAATTPTNGDWVSHDANFLTPGPRSLAPFISDPVNKVIYLVNGNTDGTSHTDFWMYQNGGWAKITAANSPACGTAYAAYDTDRAKLVAVCNDGTTSEWDGTAWNAFKDLKTKPKFTRFAAMSYDPTLKRTVLYGGWDDTNYVNSTWEWDGTTWSEMRKNAAPARSLTSMWYDPILKKTVIFGGIGRPTSQDRIERYQDMWSLDNSNGWTQVKPSLLPNTRYGAQIATDPNTGHTILFGGLRLDSEVKNGTTLFHQVYANDMWEWDGSTWKQLSSINTPSPRENGAFAWDSAKNNFVLFGGWAGYYLGDVWTLDPATLTWKPIPESTARGRIVNPSHP